MHFTQAGLLLAETEFALQVESDIAPYKGLLMGLFFMTVGMEISVGLLFAKYKVILGGIALLIIGKVLQPLHLNILHPQRPEIPTLAATNSDSRALYFQHLTAAEESRARSKAEFTLCKLAIYQAVTL